MCDTARKIVSSRVTPALTEVPPEVSLRTPTASMSPLTSERVMGRKEELLRRAKMKFSAWRIWVDDGWREASE